MKAEIISIGTRLLLSDVLDTNTAYISRSLQEMGIEVIYKVTVGDNLERIADALRIALARADVVLTTGGIKNGPHGFTRQAVAAITHTWLDPETLMLEGSYVLGSRNARDTGFILENLPGLLVCLPGNRREMAYLMETEVGPYLRAHVDLKSGLLILRTVGIMESSLRQQLADLELTPTQQISFDSYAGQTNIRLRATANSEAEIQAQLDHLREAVMARLGDHVFGLDHDRLEAVILAMLKRGNFRLAVVECHTNQALSRLLAHYDESQESIVLLPAHNQVELAQVLGMAPLTAEDTLTLWCRKASEALVRQTAVNLGLLVYNETTPGGVQLSVYLASAYGISVTQRTFGGHPENINLWACSLGLAHLHRWLLAHPNLPANF